MPRESPASNRARPVRIRLRGRQNLIVAGEQLQAHALYRRSARERPGEDGEAIVRWKVDRRYRK